MHGITDDLSVLDGPSFVGQLRGADKSMRRACGKHEARRCTAWMERDRTRRTCIAIEHVNEAQ
jgi:hypothetical protein